MILAYLVALLALEVSLTTSCNSTCAEDKEKIHMEDIKDRILKELHINPKDANASYPALSEEQIAALLPNDFEEFKEMQYILLSQKCPENITEKGCFMIKLSSHARSSILRGHMRIQLKKHIFTNLPPSQRGEEQIVRLELRTIFWDGSMEKVLEETFPVGSSEKFDIYLTPVEIKDWLSKEVAGLSITVEHEGERHFLSPAFGQDSILAGPSLVIFREPSHRRGRRESEHYCAPDANKFCCLHDFIVDFEKLGWNFIMAPKRYNAFMCRGECTNHAVKVGHSKLIKDAFLESFTCCHPTHYESLKVIYIRSDTEIVITRVPGMIARNCACT